MSEPTALVWRECICGAWYWGSAQTDADKAHSRYKARADALDVAVLAKALKRTWNHPSGSRERAEHLAREYRAILAERQQDAATDEAEKEWTKPLPKVGA